MPRKKTPTKILEKRGSWKAKTRPKEPEPEPGKTDLPEWIAELAGAEIEQLDGLGELAAAQWEDLLPKIEKMGILGETDRRALERYCMLYARWRLTEIDILENGQTYELTTRDGYQIRPRPEVKIASDLAAHLLRIETQFGLTPSARAGVKVEEEKKVDAEKIEFFKEA